MQPRPILSATGRLLLGSVLAPTFTLAQSSPLICEDSISSLPPFNNNVIPCLLGCGTPLAHATGSLLPGSINGTDIPYCRLACVRSDHASPAQSSAAPACNQQCERVDGATPDQLGWCIYWCVLGGSIASEVLATTCIPSLEYVPGTITIGSTEMATVETLSQPSAWLSWYSTQTVIPRPSHSIVSAAPRTTQLLPSATTSTIPSSTHALTSPATTTSTASVAYSSPAGSSASDPASTTASINEQNQSSQSAASSSTTISSGANAERISTARSVYCALALAAILVGV